MRAPSSLLASTFLLTAGSLLFEVSLTRQLSLVHHSGFVFAVLSVALLGLGIGAALAAVRPGLRSRGMLGTWLALACVSALLVTFTFSLPAPAPLLLIALSAVPFLFSGLTLSTIFSLYPASSHRLYWADLMGAGTGTLLALPLLDWLTAAGSASAGALLMGLAVLFIRPLPVAAAGAPALALVLLLSSGWLGPAGPGLAPGKSLSAELAGAAQVVSQAGNSFAHSHLIRRQDGSHYLYVDGAAGSLVPLTDDPRLTRDIGFLPFAAVQPDSVFLLGPGGGLDASLARLAGAERIVAAELNGPGLQLVEQVSQSGYRGVELHVDEGRSVLRRLDENFDLILLAHVITQSSDLRGFALSEASTYTVEAFSDYLGHLTPDGLLALKLYDELTLARAFFTAFTSLEDAGMTDPASHLFAALDQTAGQPLPLLIVSRAPFDRPAAVSLARQAENMGFSLLYVPGLLANPPLDGLAAGTASVELLAANAAEGGVNLLPVRDLRPFFFQFETGLPAVLQPVAYGAAAVFAASVLLLAMRRRPAVWPAAPVVFAALGTGFMATQLSLIQRSQLFLGHPTLALSLVLAVFLFGGGLGSLLGERFRRPLLWGPLLTVLFAAAWHLAWPALTEPFQGSPLALRGTLAVLSMLPLTLVLGMQFPAGLGRLAGAPGRVAGAWAVNGVYSVLGSVAAVTLGILYGYQSALLLGSACYLLVLLASLRR